MNKEETMEILRSLHQNAFYYFPDERAGWIREACDMSMKALENQKTGHWVKDEEMSIMFNIWKCSECGGGGDKHFKYCAYCGAKMGGE